ncbi:MAG: HAMP domain-containing histidine kinase [Candidatus Sericytochromatia bacterium]|uniref:histidine kinase n=1 Tax=Candidatus Tanganyikabacteria bacterium TaxID=2961651 RepID=A0A937X8I2_9BACT|nr:HAMP domain-containing histidine kinase [Candidatus Tanganyikabacteria bacterium]
MIAAQVAIALRNTNAVRALEDLARLKSEFVAIASHELRTPLSVVKGYARLLQTPGFAVDEIERQGYLDRLYDGCDRLSKLVDDLLDLARLDEGKIVLQTQDVRLAGILSRDGPMLGDRYGRTPALPRDDRVVRADEAALERILVNLLDNAFKYAEGDEPPELRWRRSPRPGRLRIEVHNRGDTFTEDELSRLFHRFGRLPRHTALPGTGLYSARTLVEQMGGEMGVEAGGGRVAFWFDLPATAPNGKH